MGVTPPILPSGTAAPRAAPASSSFSPPSLLESSLSLLVVIAALRLFGFTRTLRAIERLTRREAWRETVDRALMMATVRVIATVAALYPGRALCLEQSLTLYFCFRRRGVRVQMRLGAQPFPFEAHAWIEYDGEPLSEDREQLKRLIPFPELG